MIRGIPVTRWLARLLMVPLLGVPVMVLAVEPPALRRHMIWQVSGEGRAGWLVGSLHLGRGEMYPLPAVLDRAWRQSDELLVELDITRVPRQRMRETMTGAGVYPNDTRLDEHLVPATWARVRAAAGRLGVPLVLVQQQRPWLASITLSLLQMSRNGWSEDLGIDRLLLGQAVRDGRPIIELETFESQIALLATLEPEEQVVMLEATLDDIDNDGAAYEALLDAWRAGDGVALDRLVGGTLRDSPGGERVYAALFLNRNLHMAERFEARLEAGRRPLMVVGAGHLVGADGVAALLRERGYSVRQARTPVPRTRPAVATR